MTSPVSSLVLASASPRRRDMLERLGIALEVRPTDVDESVVPGETPAAYVARIAAAKAAEGARLAPDCWVLAADTTVTVDGQILAKAADDAEAAAMLRALSGRTHQVLTGFAISGPRSLARALERVVTTDVVFVALDDAAISDYVASGEWRDKAGAYAIQGIGASFVAAVHGSVTNVIGLPLAEVVAALRELGGPVPRMAAGRPM